MNRKRKDKFDRTQTSNVMRERQIKGVENKIVVHYRIEENGIWKKGQHEVSGKNISQSFARLDIKRNIPKAIVLRCEYVTQSEQAERI